MLSGFYANGQMAQQNLQLALTYTIALAKLRNDDLNSQYINELTGKLTPDQVNTATAAANQLVSSCCTKQ